MIDTEEKITDAAIKGSAAKRLPKHAVLIAMYGATVGEYAVISKEMTCNQAICALLPNSNYPFTYLFLLAKNSKQALTKMAIGSAQQNISQVLIKKLLVHVETNAISNFDNIAKPILESIEKTIYEIRRLTELRDTLLPRLMSGQLDVSELRI